MMSADESRDGFISALGRAYDAELCYLQAQSRRTGTVQADELADMMLDALDTRRGIMLNLEQIFAQLGEEPSREENGIARSLVARGEAHLAGQRTQSSRDRPE